MIKIFWGSVANISLEKITEAFRKTPSSFGAVVRKPGVGGINPPLAIGWQNKFVIHVQFSVALTEPKFSSQVSKSNFIVVPAAVEILAPVFASLEHLKKICAYLLNN